MVLGGRNMGPRSCVLLALEESLDIELDIGATERAGAESGIPASPTAWRTTSSRPEAATEAYRPELDAAITGGDVVLLIAIRQEVIRTATIPSWLRTTLPPARRQIVWMLPCFEGQSMTISRSASAGNGWRHRKKTPVLLMSQVLPTRHLDMAPPFKTRYRIAITIL